MIDDAELDALRARFPALQQSINDKPLIYLDNAATTQKPESVLAAMDHYYRHDNANVHRASHALSARATAAFEAAREQVRQFLNASRSDEIIWTRGTTEAINLLAYSWGEQHIGAGDEILLSTLEHHANIVPWQQLARRKGARPIVMTTVAMVAGMTPSVLALGDGGEFRSPMAIAVIGGLIVATMLSLVFVPALFTFLDDLSRLVAAGFFRVFRSEAAQERELAREQASSR